MLPECAAALRRLAEAPACTLGFLSGRSLTELERLVALPASFYAGNHGLEWEGPGIGPFLFRPSAEVRQALRQAAEASQSVVSLFPGALVEDKGLSFSVHFRAVPSHRMEAFHDSLASVQARLPQELAASPGKMALEVRPARVSDKGRVLRAILHRIEQRHGLQPLVFYLGDDLCDEPAFAAVPEEGCAVRVGDPDRHSAASYYLKDPAEVAELLGRILRAWDTRAEYRAERSDQRAPALGVGHA
jgi:trehalose-phosphatase